MGWFVLSKYYALSDSAPAYSAAILLHPSKRRKYIKQNWPDEWRDTIKEPVEQLWAEYKDLPIPEELEAAVGFEAPSQAQRKRQKPPGEYDRLVKSLDVTDLDGDSDEFERFVSGKPIKISCSPLAWWCREEQRIEYPRLSRMAINILSISPMSDEPERVFCGTRRTISWDRANLSDSSVERSQCIKHWKKNGHILKIIPDKDEISGPWSNSEVYEGSTIDSEVAIESIEQ